MIDDHFDWQGVVAPHKHLSDSIIYEVHLKGFTAHPNSNVSNSGTYLGFIDKIPYLKSLGVTTIELLPIMEFDSYDLVSRHPITGKPLKNYWGYSPVSWFAPHGEYASGNGFDSAVTEFKTLVRELHRAGIEVFLDVVFNHTAEGNHLGPVINYKGIDNSIYYFLDPKNPGRYLDFTGCGNSVKGNHPVVRDTIMSCLHYWVTQMEIDGFRFDLASVLSRDRAGHLIANPPLLEHISEDPILRDTKIIAEAWDAAGAFQVGKFPGGRWSEWNGHFRDDVRDFWLGKPGKANALATRLLGSSDLYLASARRPFHSINFITAHDGFTLNDLVSYNRKHNWLNGEENRDGENHNRSFNHGVEGPSNDAGICELRFRQMKNLLATLLLAQGVPMLNGGDEFGRTQFGNNNAFCHDGPLSWIDWRLQKKNAELFSFTSGLIQFRKQHPILRRRNFFTGLAVPGRKHADAEWFEATGQPKDWYREENLLMLRLNGSAGIADHMDEDDDLLMLFNATRNAVPFILPNGEADARPWFLVFDTAQHQPSVYLEYDGPRHPAKSAFIASAHSMICFRSPKR